MNGRNSKRGRRNTFVTPAIAWSTASTFPALCRVDGCWRRSGFGTGCAPDEHSPPERGSSAKSHLRPSASRIILDANLLHTTDSKYVEKKGYLSRYSHERMVELRESRSEPIHEFGSEEEWSRCLRDDLTRFV